MARIRIFAVPSLLFAAACAGSSPTPPPPGNPGPDRPVTPNEQTANTLGMTILSSDATGAPRLMRAIAPRAAAAGMAPGEAARDHVAAHPSVGEAR